MWAQLATVLRFSLRAVIARPLPAAIFGAVGGPIAFLAGQRLGAVTLLPPLAPGVLRLSLTWAIALVLFSVAVRRLTADDHAPVIAAGYRDDHRVLSGSPDALRI